MPRDADAALVMLSRVAVTGLFAWFLWRGIYLAKLPSLERKVRVLVDWMVELFFPRDIVQTIDFDYARPEASTQAPVSRPDHEEQQYGGSRRRSVPCVYL